MPSPFSPSSDAAPYPSVIIHDHPRKKNTVKSPPFSSDAAPYLYDHTRKIITAKQPPSSSDAAPYPPPVIILEHPREKNIVKRPLFSLPPSISSPFIKSKPREKNIVVRPLFISPPRIFFPLVESKPKRFDNLQSVTSQALPQPGEKNIIKHPAFSPTSDAASLLKFHSDSDDDVPDHLPMVLKDQSASPKLGRSNTMTGTKKLTTSSKWNNGWGFWKKNEGKRGNELRGTS